MDEETKSWMKFTSWVVVVSGIIAMLSCLGLVVVLTYYTMYSIPSIFTLGYTFVTFGILALVSRHIRKRVCAHIDKMEHRKQD